VGDEEIGQPEPRLEVLSRVDDLRWTETSRALVGSSQTMSLGRTASALAMADPLALPAENSCGYTGLTSAAAPPARAAHHAPLPPAGRSLGASMPSAMMAATVMRGVHRGIGVLEDHLHLAAPLAQRPPRSAVRSWPSKRTVPEVAETSRRIAFPIVVLPATDSPTSAAWSGGYGERDPIDGAHIARDAAPETLADREMDAHILTSSRTVPTP